MCRAVLMAGSGLSNGCGAEEAAHSMRVRRINMASVRMAGGGFSNGGGAEEAAHSVRVQRTGRAAGCAVQC